MPPDQLRRTIAHRLGVVPTDCPGFPDKPCRRHQAFTNRATRLLSEHACEGQHATTTHIKWCRQWRRASKKGAENGAVRLAPICTQMHRFSPICTSRTGSGSAGRNAKAPGIPGLSALDCTDLHRFALLCSSGRGGTRTRTSVTRDRILNPERLPFRHSAQSVSATATDSLKAANAMRLMHNQAYQAACDANRLPGITTALRRRPTGPGVRSRSSHRNRRSFVTEPAAEKRPVPAAGPAALPCRRSRRTERSSRATG